MRKQKEIGRTSSRRIKRLAWAAIMVAVFALGVMAAVSLRTSRAAGSAPQHDQSRANVASRSNLSLRVGAQEMPVGQTGQIRPLTQEEAQKLADGIKKLVNQSTDGLQSVRHADGSVSIDLEGRFQNIAIARRDEDGKVIQSCVDNREAAAAFFGIDPQLVGVPARVGSSKTGAAVLEKGGNR